MEECDHPHVLIDIISPHTPIDLAVKYYVTMATKRCIECSADISDLVDERRRNNRQLEEMMKELGNYAKKT